MTRTHRKRTEERLDAAAPHAFASGEEVPPSEQPEREREMAEFGIGFDGVHYGYRGYRYDRLADAVAYASLMRARPAQQDAGGPFNTSKALAAPNDEERTLMATLAIKYDNGAYRFEGFRYDRLSDAVNYAKLVLQRKDSDGSGGRIRA